MAKITKMSFQAVVSTGRYETKRLEVEAELEAKDDPNEIAEALEAYVMQRLGRGPTEQDLIKAAETLSKASKLKNLKVK